MYEFTHFGHKFEAYLMFDRLEVTHIVDVEVSRRLYGRDCQRIQLDLRRDREAMTLEGLHGLCKELASLLIASDSFTNPNL